MEGKMWRRGKAYSPKPILCWVTCEASDISTSIHHFQVNISKTLIFLPRVFLLLCLHFLLVAFLTNLLSNLGRQIRPMWHALSLVLPICIPKACRLFSSWTFDPSPFPSGCHRRREGPPNFSPGDECRLLPSCLPIYQIHCSSLKPSLNSASPTERAVLITALSPTHIYSDSLLCIYWDVHIVLYVSGTQ